MRKDLPCPLHLNIKKLHKMLIPGIENYLLCDESLGPKVMILMGPRALGMGLIIDVLNHWKFKKRPQDTGS